MINRWAKWFDWRAMLAAVGLVLVSATVTPAQEAVDVADLSRWLKYCVPDPVNGQEGCVVLFQLYANPTTVVTEVRLSYLIQGSDILFQVLIPMYPTGLFLAEGMQLQIDNQEPTIIEYLLCDANVCMAQTTVGDDFVARMKAGGQLMVGVVVADAEAGGARQIDLPITLVGFTAAFDGEGLTPEEAAVDQQNLNQELQDRAEAARQRLIEQQQQLNANP